MYCLEKRLLTNGRIFYKINYAYRNYDLAMRIVVWPKNNEQLF